MTTPQLDDDRVAAMRSAVMSTVDADVRGRGRRLRRGLAGGVAAALLVVVAGAGVSLVQVQGGAVSAGSSAEDSSSDSPFSADAVEPSRPGDPVAPRDLESETGPSVEVERQVVTTGEASVVVTDPRRESARIVAWVEQLGGRVDRREEDGSGAEQSASLTIRVPADQLDTVADRLADSGPVERISFRDEDVTGTVADLDARIRALQISIDRLEGILADATSSEQLLQAESALTTRQAELDSLKSQRSAVGDQVRLARLDVTLMQRDGAEGVDPGGFRGGLTDGWNALVTTVNGAVTAGGAVLPWAAVLLAGYLVVRLVGRLRR